MSTVSAPSTDRLLAAARGAVGGSPLDILAINTIRTLCMDAVQQANSGHPGTPMSMAPVLYTLFQRFLRFDPDNPIWPNRDRFVLSAGHASTLQYSLLHLMGVKAVNPAYEALGELAVKEGHKPDKILCIDDLCSGKDVFFAATGITTGELLKGVRYEDVYAYTQSMVLRSASGTMRIVDAYHPIDKLRVKGLLPEQVRVR